MRITGWTDWKCEGESCLYKKIEPSTIKECEEIEQIIADELRNKGYKFTGDYHQNGDFGVPIFDGNMIYQCSQRSWGAIMLTAYPEEIDDSDGYGYTEWAWIAPYPMIIPNNDDYRMYKIMK